MFDDDYLVWDGLVEVFGNMCYNLMVVLSVEKIILGGGVMQKLGIVDKIVVVIEKILNDYVVFLEGRLLQDVICILGFGMWFGMFGVLVLFD